MKNKSLKVVLLAIVCVFVVVSIFPCYVYATGENFSPETGIENLNLKVLEEEPPKRLITAFDVRDDGWFVVGLDTQEILIFDEEKTFQYGYSIDVFGDYSVEFSGDNIAIYLIRGDYVAIIDKQGNCASYEEADAGYIDEILYRTSKRIGNTEYSLERDVGLFAGDNARLVEVNSAGDRTVLYDATSFGLLAGIWHYILVAGAVACIIGGAVFYLKKKW